MKAKKVTTPQRWSRVANTTSGQRADGSQTVRRRRVDRARTVRERCNERSGEQSGDDNVKQEGNMTI